MKKYTMTFTGDDKNVTITRVSSGCNMFEIVGIHVSEISQLLKQIEEQTRNEAGIGSGATKQ